MSKEVMKASPKKKFLNSEQVKIIKNSIMPKGSSDNELAYFISVCTTHKLDPITRQIYAMKTWAEGGTKITAQVSIDGFRIIADRSGKYAGQLGPFWCGEDGKWVDVWLKDSPPAAAKVGVMRIDFKEPLWGVARFNAYAQRNKRGELNMTWAKMPDLMIAKVAESLALRRAFPNELSGLYSIDEMSSSTIKDASLQVVEHPEYKEESTSNVYKINFGTKFKGKTLNEVGHENTHKMFNYFTDEVKNGKELTKEQKVFMQEMKKEYPDIVLTEKLEELLQAKVLGDSPIIF